MYTFKDFYKWNLQVTVQWCIVSFIVRLCCSIAWFDFPLAWSLAQVFWSSVFFDWHSKATYPLTLLPFAYLGYYLPVLTRTSDWISCCFEEKSHRMSDSHSVEEKEGTLVEKSLKVNNKRTMQHFKIFVFRNTFSNCE